MAGKVLLCCVNEETRARIAQDFRKRGMGVFEIASPRVDSYKLRVEQGNPLGLMSIVIPECERKIWQQWVSRLCAVLPLTVADCKVRVN